MTAQLDHLVVGCKDLASAELWMEDMLGVPALGGAKHEVFGTHNKLWNLGSAYLELIAVDPDAADPGRARWFGLDDPQVQARLESGPRLLTWMVRVDDLAATMAASLVPLGELVEMSRGDMAWKVAVPSDGALQHGGQVPGFIEWKGNVHPATKQMDQGLRISRIVAEVEEPAALERITDALGIKPMMEIRNTAIGQSLMAEIVTSDGNISFVS